MLTRFAAIVSLAALMAGPALAQGGPQISVSYAPKAETAMVKTYGVREKEVLEKSLAEALSESLDGRVARVEVTVNDIQANRPTIKQMGDKPGLSFQSFGIGGADLTGKAYDASGQLLGEVTYDWYGDIHWAYTNWVWSDAERAMERFSEELARATKG